MEIPTTRCMSGVYVIVRMQLCEAIINLLLHIVISYSLLHFFLNCKYIRQSYNKHQSGFILATKWFSACQFSCITMNNRYPEDVRCFLSGHMRWIKNHSAMKIIMNGMLHSLYKSHPFEIIKYCKIVGTKLYAMRLNY